MVEQNSKIIEFYTNGYKTRVVCIIPQKRSYMFQTSDDRYLERYWDWDNQCDRNEITSTRGNVVNPELRKLNNEGCDLVIIRDCIAALNYNILHSKIENSIKENIKYIIEGYRCMMEMKEEELLPYPVPYPKDSEITNMLGFNTISKYGVTLKRLTHDKIELVRRWRNDPKISQYMEFREEITPEMQENWFKKIDNIYNFYFIIEAEGKEIGLINIRDIDYEKRTGEPGIFIWDDDYLNSTYSFKASFCLGDFIWDVLKLKKLISHILKDNKRAIQYNKILGYKLSEGQENNYNQEYSLDVETDIKVRKKLLKYIL